MLPPSLPHCRMNLNSVALIATLQNIYTPRQPNKFCSKCRVMFLVLFLIVGYLRSDEGMFNK
jgi:hypothetical protein